MIALGPFEVSAPTAEVATFAHAARLDVEGVPSRFPFTWPIRWLARPEIRAALLTLISEGDLVPFHESQTFDYVAPLETDAGYKLEVAARREPGPPDRIVVEGRVTADGGATVATVETVLRLFSTKREKERAS